jgi:Ca-activated chloride channel family protein
MNTMNFCAAALLLCMPAMAQPITVLGVARAVASEKPATPLDQASLVQAANEPAVLSGFQSGPERSLGQLEFLRARGGAALLDAIYLGLSQAASGRNERKVLVVISDGGDNSSRYTESDIANAIRDSCVRLFIVGMDDATGGAALLSREAERTGAGCFNLTRRSDAPAIAAEVRAAVRARP